MNYDLQQSRNATAGDGVWFADDMEGELKAWSHRGDHERLNRERNLRLEEQGRERARIARELHDGLLQGFVGASLVLHDAVDRMPADSPSKSSLSRVLGLMQRVIEEGRMALQGLRSPRAGREGIEQALSELAEEFAISQGAGFRVFVMGKPQTLNETVQEQIYLIAREALVNALRHSDATKVEAEVEYLPGKVRVIVRDDGRGIDPEVLRDGRDAHWGLVGMRERAASIGARLRVWSRLGAGTEVEISVSADMTAEACAYLENSTEFERAVVA